MEPLTDEEIRAVIEANEGLRTTLATLCGADVWRTRAELELSRLLLPGLIELGLAERSSNGRYRATDKGRELSV